MLVLIGGVSLLLAACGAPETPAPPTTAAPAPPAAQATQEPRAEPTPETGAAPAEPQRIEFQSGDGTALVGTYYPPGESPAPAVVLMHQMRASKEDWLPLIDALQAAGDYALFAFDFPGYGESGGAISDEAALAAARAAVEQVTTLDGADADRLVLIGASIGADAAVDVCTGGCVGAVSVSPGGWLGIPYVDALAALDGVDVFCLAAEGDSPAPETCTAGSDASIGLSGLRTFSMQIYEGRAHGNALVADADAAPGQPPLEAIPQWLSARLEALP